MKPHIEPIIISEQILNGKRLYSRNGKSFPSVTTVLSATRDNSFLEKWNAENPGAREAAASRGTAFHSCIENYLRHRQADASESIAPYFRSVFNFVKDLEPLFLEVPIFSEQYGYAGRVDCGAIYGGWVDGIPLIIDWKTSAKKKYKWYDYPLQLAAYLQGFKETYPDYPINFEYTLICCATPKEGQIELFEPYQVQQYWNQFKSRLENYHAKHNLHCFV